MAFFWSSGGTAKLSTHIKNEIAKQISKVVLDGAHFGFAMGPVDSDDTWYQSGGGLKLNPASNVKIITSLAALHLLKPEFRFKTKYYRSGELVDGILQGDIYVKGYGDPTVVTERLYIVAKQLQLRGIKHIAGSIIVDDSYFDGLNIAAGFANEKKPYRAYAAPTSALSFNFNTTTLYVRSSPTKNQAYIAIDPPVDYIQLAGKVKTTRYGRRIRAITYETPLQTMLSVTGYMGKRASPKRYFRRIWHPSLYFASSLKYFLAQHGVTLEQDTKRGLVPDDAKLLLTDYSHPLTEVIRDLNHYSNNFIAEMLIKAIGAQTAVPATFHAGLVNIREFLETEVGITQGTYMLNNGSGLNNVNRFTANQFLKLLRYAYRNFEMAPEFIGSLSVSGARGTIQKRMKQEASKRKIRAKTGTLRGISALSGYVVTPSEQVLAFSILVHGHQAPSYRIWQIQDKIAQALAQIDAPLNTLAPKLDKPIEPPRGG